jgi:tRNA acetyltransferase TAN1
VKEFNLVVSTYRFGEADASDEILFLLENFGDAAAVCEITEIKGILLVQTSIKPTEVVQRLKELASAEPWQLHHIMRVIPVSIVVPTEINEIIRAVDEIGREIGEEDTFRITVEKRHSSLTSKEIIDAIASRFHNKVDLENPDWTIMVQIIGSQAGLATLRSDEIFSSVVEKRK